MQDQTASPLFHADTLGDDEVKLLATLILDEPDHYTVLGVDAQASSEEINEAYRLAVANFHPLSHRLTVERDPVFQWLLSNAFTRLGTAYQILSSPRRREVYDRCRRADQAAASVGEPLARPLGGEAPACEQELNLQSYSLATPEWLSAGQTDGKERRRVIRVNMRIPVVVTCEDLWQEPGETRDLSPLGATLALTRYVEPGTLLRLQLCMPSQLRTRDYQAESYRINGCVLRTTRRRDQHVLSVEFI